MEAKNTHSVTVHQGAVTFDDLLKVARGGAHVQLGEDALAAIARGRAVVDRLADDSVPHYGVSTGFGALASVSIAHDQRKQLQRSLVRSHAASSGAIVEAEVIRGLMLLRLSTVATGHTGVRVETAQAYAAMISAGIVPVVGEYGSLGCSGDLAPLAHCALALMGEGEVFDASGARRPAAEALAEAGLQPVELVEKEGLALINGTDGMLAMLVLAHADLVRLFQTADVAAALSIEGQSGVRDVFAPDLQALRPHVGQAESAANIFALLHGSDILANAKKMGASRVQDAYSLRCSPQVHGGARDTLTHAAQVANIELASAVDNPTVTDDGRLESNGNFHGAPLAYVLDFLAIVTADMASISERRTDRALDPARNGGLPAFLTSDPGVDSGYMIAQYTQAGIVNELKRCAVPASADSIPTSAMQEDHVSMGWNAGRKLRRAIDGLERVLAVELLVGARAVDLRADAAAAPTEAVHRLIREAVPASEHDKWMAPQIEAVRRLVATGAIVDAAATGLGQSSLR